MSAGPDIESVRPSCAIEGGRVTLIGSGLFDGGPRLPRVHVQQRQARVVFASADRLTFAVPSGITEGGRQTIQVDGFDAVADVHIATPVATGLHQVDSPVVDAAGNLYLTYSGTRGQQVPVSIFRVGPSGTRETFSAGIMNPTSMAFGPDDRLYVSSRFEGAIYRLDQEGSAETFATDLGLACGLVFGSDGTLYVGDRSGTIFAVDRTGHARRLTSLPASVAAFHLTLGEDGLYATGPTLGSYDPVYHVPFAGEARIFSQAFGRPQGLTVGPDGSLFVVEALAGASGLYRLRREHAPPELVLAGPGLIGVTFDRAGNLIVCTNETAYRLGPGDWGFGIASGG